MKGKSEMKKVLLTLLAIVVLIGVLGGVGLAGYHIGYRQGALAITDGTIPRFDRLPGFDRDEMPQFHPGMNDRNFNRGVAPSHFFMMQRGEGFGFFSPFQFLWRLAIIGLIIWVGYQLFKGNGWQLSLTRHSTIPPTEEPVTAKKKTTKTDG
jgi:hypothetical protein